MSPLSRIGLLLPALAACSANALPQDAPDADASQVAAVVVVERSTGPGEAAHAESVAKFLRTRSAIDDATRAIAGEDLELPALGECKSLAGWGNAAPSRAVELLDVGALAIDGSESHAALVARRVPDVVDLVGGVVYTAREAPAFGGPVSVRAAGSQDVEAFSITADAPAPIESLRVGGADVGAAQVFVGGSAAGVDVSWAPGGDTVYVDIATGRAPASTRCAFADDGSATLPALSLGDSGTIAIHRVRQSPLHAKGVDEGVLRFDTSRVVAYVRR